MSDALFPQGKWKITFFLTCIRLLCSLAVTEPYAVFPSPEADNLLKFLALFGQTSLGRLAPCQGWEHHGTELCDAIACLVRLRLECGLYIGVEKAGGSAFP